MSGAAPTLLGELGLGEGEPYDVDTHAEAWDRSGALALTGAPTEPLLPAAPAPQAIETALQALEGLAPEADLEGLDAGLLGERAALAGGTRGGDVSVGRSARLLRTRDGWIAPNLPRPEDWGSVPAWLETPIDPDDWSALARAVRARECAPLVSRGRELGLALGDPPRDARPARWCRGLPDSGARGRPDEAGRPFRVIDLSALWAGPLCGDLLRRAGGEVIKLESSARPDGARRGPARFFDLLNAGKRSVALEFRDAEGRRLLAALLETADVVLEGTRPRALAQLGIDAVAWVRARPGRVWCSITGHGREAPMGGWVGFGDDAAVSGGLVAWHGGRPMFVGDAIADPLTGVHAAVAVLAARRLGGAALLDVALAEVARAVAGAGRGRETNAWPLRPQPPTARPPAPSARPLGADTGDVLAALSPRGSGD